MSLFRTFMSFFRSRRKPRPARRLFESLDSRTFLSVAPLTQLIYNSSPAIQSALPQIAGPDNHPPTLSSIKSFKTATAAVAFPITFADLLSHSNAKDPDSDIISFQITSIPSKNTITINGNTALPGDIIHPGDLITYTGPKQKGGTRKAFSVKAFDGTSTSAKSAAVKVQTILKGDIKISVNRTTLHEDSTKTATFTIKRKRGDQSLPTTVAYTITGTSSNDGSDYTPILTGFAIIPANAKSVTFTIAAVGDNIPEGDDGKETVILTLINTPEANTYLVNPSHSKVTVKILDPKS